MGRLQAKAKNFRFIAQTAVYLVFSVILGACGTGGSSETGTGEEGAGQICTAIFVYGLTVQVQFSQTSGDPGEKLQIAVQNTEGTKVFFWDSSKAVTGGSPDLLYEGMTTRASEPSGEMSSYDLQNEVLTLSTAGEQTGMFRITAFHPTFGQQSQDVQVQSDGCHPINQTVNFSF